MEQLKKGGVGRMKGMRKKGTALKHGLINSDVPGRTDKINLTVPNNGYVIPADIVAALGEGNTLAGAKRLDSITGSTTKKGSGFASGGVADIVVAGGEYYVSPEACAKIGEGNPDHGHAILEALVNHVREENIKEQEGLPPPKK